MAKIEFISMLISDFDYVLPDEKIALFGPKVRGSTKLLVLDRQNGTVSDNLYSNLDQYLQAGDLVVLNDTRVIPAKLLGFRNPDQKKQINQEPSHGIEILLTEFHADYLERLEDREWTVVYRGNIRAGDFIEFSKKYNAEVLEILLGGLARLKFNCNPVALAIELGEMPIPPYLKRESSVDDMEKYQTEFGVTQGSVAAPTASLNFTNELKERLLKKGVRVEYLTLHVGLGTFMPVRVDDVCEHVMHAEYFEIPEQTVLAINQTKKAGRKVVAVGTTVCRTLEYAAEEIRNTPTSCRPEHSEGSKTDSDQDASLRSARQTKSSVITGEADIFIYPGYEFKLVDILLTNFHAPRSTPLLLVSAFAGFDLLMKGYQNALNSDYKFLSFGDSCLVI